MPYAECGGAISVAHERAEVFDIRVGQRAHVVTPRVAHNSRVPELTTRWFAQVVTHRRDLFRSGCLAESTASTPHRSLDYDRRHARSFGEDRRWNGRYPSISRQLFGRTAHGHAQAHRSDALA